MLAAGLGSSRWVWGVSYTTEYNSTRNSDSRKGVERTRGDSVGLASRSAVATLGLSCTNSSFGAQSADAMSQRWHAWSQLQAQLCARFRWSCLLFFSLLGHLLPG